eukprot:scaffold3644_cov58-Attheya_sp.AAC.3
MGYVEYHRHGWNNDLQCIASSFNQDISAWDTSSVLTMNSMFKNAASFNEDVFVWDMPSVTNMSYMFYKAKSFQQDISSWDMSNVTMKKMMFHDVESCNEDTSDLDTSSAKQVCKKRKRYYNRRHIRDHMLQQDNGRNIWPYILMAMDDNMEDGNHDELAATANKLDTFGEHDSE